MRLFRHYSDLPQSARGAVVTMGNFDGVHLGHRAVIERARQEAMRLDAPVAVLTFEPHPRQVFRPEDPPFRLGSMRIKVRLLEELAIDLVFVLQFDSAFSHLDAAHFVDQVLVAGLAARHVVVGHDFRFGHKRGGDVAFLEERGRSAGFGVTAVNPVGVPSEDEDGDEVVYSSSAIRRHLREGRVGEANAILGRRWEVEGRVVLGDKLGRQLGFPTANIELGDFLRPAHGVYAVRAGVDEGTRTRWYDGVANFGIRPTVQGREERFEVHLFDMSADLYGRHLRVRFHDFIRGERRFEGLDALKAQISADCRTAHSLLAACPPDHE